MPQPLVRDASRAPEREGPEAAVPHGVHVAVVVPAAGQSMDSERMRRKDWVSVVLLGLTVLGLNADQNLMAPNLTAIGKTFGFDGAERDTRLGGHIPLAFFCIGAPFGVLAGSLVRLPPRAHTKNGHWPSFADVYNRKYLFAFIVLFSEIPCLCTYFITSYWQLFALRALSGISIGGSPPILFSLLGDIVPKSRRSLISSLMQICLGAGVAGGQLLAGFFSSGDSWRVPFLIVSSPTIIFCALIFLFVEEPKRAGKEEAFMRPSQNSPADAAETELSGAVAGASGAQHSRKDERDQSKGEEASHARSRASWDEDPTTSRGDDSAADSHSTGARAGAGPVSESTRHAARLSEDDDGGARVHRGAQALSGAEPERASGADKDGAALAAGVSGEEKEAEEYAEQIDFRKVGLLFAIPSNILMYAQSIPGCVPWGVMSTFFNDFVAQDRGMKVQEATQILLAFGAGGALGIVGGGFLAQWLYNRRKWTMPVLMGVCTTVAIGPVLYIINGPVTGAGYQNALCAAFLAGVFASVTAGNNRAVLLNVNSPETRGTAFAVYALLDGLGKGFGPFMASSLIVTMGSRTKAFNVAVSLWALCGIFLFLIAFTLGKDEAKLQKSMATAMEKKHHHNGQQAAPAANGTATNGGERAAGASNDMNA